MANTVIGVKMGIMVIHLVVVRTTINFNHFHSISMLGAEKIHLFLYHSIDCDCDFQGALAEVCDKDSGQCLCKDGYEVPRCDRCLPGYYNYPECIKCNCSTVGSASFTCDPTGKCPCLNNFASKQCTQCSAGYYDYPQCLRKFKMKTFLCDFFFFFIHL